MQTSLRHQLELAAKKEEQQHQQPPRKVRVHYGDMEASAAPRQAKTKASKRISQQLQKPEVVERPIFSVNTVEPAQNSSVPLQHSTGNKSANALQLSKCKHCSRTFRRIDSYRQHLSDGSCALPCVRYRCSFCEVSFQKREERESHERRHLIVNSRQQTGAGFDRLEDVHGCSVFRREFEEEESVTTIESAFTKCKADLKLLMTQQLRHRKMLRAGTVLLGRFATLDDDGNIDQQTDLPLRTPYRRLFLGDERSIPHKVAFFERVTLERLDELETTGSGWILLRVLSLTLEAGKCTLVGACNTGLPVSRFTGREFLVDTVLRSKPNWCFLSAIAQHFISEHDEATTLDWIGENLKFNPKHLPMNINSVRFFEKRNSDLGLGVNVFLREGKDCYPAYRSKFNNPSHIVNLLLVQLGGSSEGETWHYAYISDLDSFLCLYNNADGTRRRFQSVHCHNCLSNFTCAATLRAHEEICFSNKTQLITMPDVTKKLEFEAHNKKFGHEFVGFADFEAVLKPDDRKSNANCENCKIGGNVRNCNHATHVQNTQEPICYALVFVDRNREVVFQRCQTAPNVMALFFDAVDDAKRLLLPRLQAAKESMIWTEEDDARYTYAQVCHVCEKPFNPTDSDFRKVRDHCHKTGKAIGACHQKCNRERRVKKYLLIYIHNFKGYDSHFIIKNAKKSDSRIRGLASNTQKFRTLKIDKIKFVDSLSLLNAGLAELVRDLGKDHSYPILASSGIYETRTQRQLLLEGKGIFPYEYVSDFSVLSETRLPPIEKFYSLLREETVTTEEYYQAVTTFSIFECRDLADYTRLYCLLDTLLLAEVMFEFISEAYADFGLDATNYISIPQLSFDAMLKMTGVQLDYIPDKEMILCFERGIRGGVSYVNTRMVNVEKEGGVIVYLDFNNLYGWAQMQNLPVGNYRWLSQDELERLNYTELSDDSSTGYALEVDLEYPDEFRKQHTLMPLAPEHLDVFYNDLSGYSKECLRVNRSASVCQRYHSRKLCGTFYPKRKYLVHYRNLKFYVKHGLKVTKVHRVIEFEQAPFAKPYIEFTAEKRKKATSDFKKMTAKLCANGNFGKWLQNARKYIDVKFAHKESTTAKYLGSPRFISFRILNEALVAVFLHNKEVRMDRKFSVGFSILELSKLLMYECLYEMVLPNFGHENVDLILSDTDSYIFHIKNFTKDEVRSRMSSIMDFSNLTKDDPLYDSSRSKVPGYLKDEIPNGDIIECIAPKSKCYALKSRSRVNQRYSVEKKCKGVARARVKRLKMSSYRNCILTKQAVKATMARIQVKDHKIQTVLQNKICMTSFDDKRYLLSCGVHSRPYQLETQSDRCDRCESMR